MRIVQDEELETALASLSRIIERYGDIYWPIFERLESELQARHARSARLARYRKGSIRPRLQERGVQSS